MKITPIEFQNNLKLTLRGYVHEPREYDTAVVYLHGFPGHMSGSALRMCRSLSRLGYLCLRFDFSGTDTSEGKFEDKLMSQEAKDVRYAIDFLTKHYKFKKLVLIGHSTGAIDAALYAHRDKRISKLVLSGGLAKLDEAARYDFTDRQVRDFWTKGFVRYSDRERWTYGFKIKKAFYDEFFTLNIPRSLSKYRRPVLIVHGENDRAVPCAKNTRELMKATNRPKKLVIIKGADHGFDSPRHWRQYVAAIDRFIKARQA